MTESEASILEVKGVSKSFIVGRHFLRPPDILRAVVDVNLTVQAGAALGIVGESGSGKTTLARIIARLIEPDKGRILMAGQDLTSLSGARLARGEERHANGLSRSILVAQSQDTNRRRDR